MHRIEANNKLGYRWAMQLTGAHSAAGIDPFTLLMLIQAIAALTTIYKNLCKMDPEAMHAKLVGGLNDRERVHLGRSIRRQIGWYRWVRHGQYRLVESLELACKLDMEETKREIMIGCGGEDE